MKKIISARKMFDLEKESSFLTVVNQVYFQRLDGTPTSIPACRFSQKVLSKEQPYIREIIVTEEWTKLDYGWIAVCGLMQITNEEGKHLRIRPTPEETEEVKSRIVEIGIMSRSKQESDKMRTMHSPKIVESPKPEVYWYVAPGRFFQGQPADLTSYYLRCQSGTARCVLNLFPI